MPYAIIQESLISQIEALSKEISKRGEKLCPVEAKILHDNLASLINRMDTNQIDLEKYYDDLDELRAHLKVSSTARPKAILLLAKLQRIFTPYDPTTSMMNHHFTHPTDLDSLHKIQNFLIEQIRSMEPKSESVASSEAEILFIHLTQLYEKFTWNQAQIHTQVSGSALDTQLELLKKIQWKVIAVQTKLKKIATESSSSSSSKVNCPFIHQFEVEQKKRMYDHLCGLYDTFNALKCSRIQISEDTQQKFLSGLADIIQKTK